MGNEFMNMLCDLHVTEFLAHYNLYFSLEGINHAHLDAFPLHSALAAFAVKTPHAVLETMMPANVYDSPC